MWIATLTRFILLLLLSSVCGYESYDYAENGENPDYEYEEEETFADFVPIFQTDPTTYTVDKGNTARLVCQVDQLGPMVISWKKVKEGGNLAYVAAGKSVMDNPDRFSVKVDDVSSTLTILLVNRQDVGQYICEVSSQPPVTLKHTVEIKAPPSVSILGKPESGRLTFKSGAELALVCEGDGDPKPNIKWRRQNKKMPDGSVEMEADQIIYNSIDRRHVGTYICEGDNGFGALAVDSIHIQVLYQPTVNVYWTFLHPSDSVVLELVCMVHANPPAKIEWKRNDKPLQDGRFRLEHQGSKHILTIDSPTKYDMGIYTCTASNYEGTVDAVLEVEAPPHFEIKSRSQTALKGESTVLQCEAEGEQPIGILWNMNNKRLDANVDPRYTIREEILSFGVLSTISIRGSERGDSSLFTCVATNAFGSDNTSINLIIQEVPETPYGLKVLEKSGRNVKLSWQAPYNGNSNLTRYLIEYKYSKGTWQNDIDRVLVGGDETIAGVFSLRPATSYHFRIVAQNEIGSSGPSDTVTIETSEEKPDGPPVDVKLSAIDQHTLLVNWKPPLKEHWNGAILGYYVRYKKTSKGDDNPYVFDNVEFIKEQGTKHTLQISNLEVFTEYAIVVQACNKIGQGPMSEEAIMHTAEGASSKAPARRDQDVD